MKQQHLLGRLLFVCCFFFNSAEIFAQETQDEKIIDVFLNVENVAKADSVLQKQIAYYEGNNELDSLCKYPYYVGKIAALKTTSKNGIIVAEQFITELEHHVKNHKSLSRGYANLSLLYDDLGENQKSYDVSVKALTSITKYKDATPEEIGKAHYNVGSVAQTLGYNDEAKQRFRETKRYYEGYSETSKVNLSKMYNANAVMHYLSSKLDSAELYFKKASKAIENAEGDMYENLLDATVINSNVMLVQYTQGNTSEALKTLEQVVKNYHIILKNISDESMRTKVMRYNSNALSNLAVIYNEIGNVRRATEVLEYTYADRKKFLEPTDPFLINILIQMGQNQISLLNYDEALVFLLEAKQLSDKSTGHSNYWKAAGRYALALAYKGNNDLVLAEKYFKEAEPLFQNSLKDEYDAEFLGFLRDKALFLSEKGEISPAITTAFKGYNYVKNNESTSLILVKEIENVATVYYNLEDYEEAQQWALDGITFLNQRIQESKTSIDSIQVDFRKPGLILLEAKAAFKLQSKRDVPFLRSTLEKLNNATVILERRKTISYSDEAITLLLKDYKYLVEFSKEVQIQLFDLTGDESYLDKVVSLHESSLYNRIRSRLNVQQDISFSNVSAEVLAREQLLKEKMSKSLVEKDTVDASIKKYISASDTFEVFLDSLRVNFPKYYQMRYATIAKSLAQVQQNIPANTTVVRYVFVAEKLYAFVISKEQKTWVSLPFSEKDSNIIKLLAAELSEKETTALLHQLYKQLWQPIAPKISTEKVLVIPDGSLYNVSFESLTTERVSTYKEAVEKSLLNTYVFSYHFSMLLVKDEKTTTNFKKKFVAFAPEFSNAMKSDYTHAISDSIVLDKSYLTLLAQPFTIDLINKYSEKFKGKSYLNQAAQKNTFVANAGHHKIIHIGTHAESNNIRPSLSRLIFAKDIEHDSLINNNSLYTYEIYNHDLDADLTVLTACETGKPTYQSGEGMISLSHAFTYAGSKSILTSLWEIDEKSSATIVDYFYENLRSGMDKDVALKQAKLAYLATAEGRTRAPQYWAGLILIGDTSPIHLAPEDALWIWIVSILALLLLLFFVFRRRNRLSS
ncbi:CHAT domain-containing protein [Rasiella rasia]|uniref:CHAT domain-containing protein n=1 Tax=Rasiella rasia TaxID=2744027 RepID=A0A6G6GNG8_9FLAO|nr:CHAT domain-containing tetratricopeptide repeat protein [Rasiella rasia]QIE60099.1 CHAT domain-containing protein [Rasiella rasia]